MSILHETAIERGLSLPFELGAEDATGYTVSRIKLEDGGKGAVSTTIVEPAAFDFIVIFPVSVVLTDGNGQKLYGTLHFVPEEDVGDTRTVNAAA
jgi:hypothetical protein